MNFSELLHFGSRKDGWGDGDLLSAFSASVSSQTARTYRSSSSSPFSRDTPVLIDDNIFAWYRTQTHTLICKLELRKERVRPWHEFIVIYVDDSSAYRVDRRLVGGPSLEVILAKGCEAEDSIKHLSQAQSLNIQSITDCKIRVQFDSEQKPDLKTILVISHTIHKNPDTEKYTLQEFNCYFVARTIITLITRHYLLRYSTLFTDLRWYALTESAISQCLLRDHWEALDKAMKDALVMVLEKTLWPIVKQDAELLLNDKNQWQKLESDMKDIIRNAVEESDVNLIGESLKEIVCRWVLEAAQATLWYDSLERNLSDQSYKTGYEQCAGSVLHEAMKPGLEQRLPDGIGDRLPKRLVNRLPPSLLASLPPELMARLPFKLLEKSPKEIFQNIPDTFVQNAPDEYLQALPATTFEQAPTRVVLRLPEDLQRVPQGLLDVSLRRIQIVLEDAIPSEQCYRPLALNLLKRLPEDLLQRLPEEYRDIRSTHATNDDEPRPIAPLVGATSATTKEPAKVSPLDYIIRAVPRPILARIPPFMVELYPISWYKGLSAEAVALLPIEVITKSRPRFLAKVPSELLEKIPESTLRSLPREMLERLPDELLHRLPVRLLSSIPDELLNNLPENVTDLLREAVASEIFGGDELRMALSTNAGNVVNKALRGSRRGKLPNFVRISFDSQSDGKSKYAETYEDLQEYILKMNKKHSKMVARAAHFGVGEKEVYDNLRQKKEDIWRDTYPVTSSSFSVS